MRPFATDGSLCPSVCLSVCLSVAPIEMPFELCRLGPGNHVFSGGRIYSGKGSISLCYGLLFPMPPPTEMH